MSKLIKSSSVLKGDVYKLSQDLFVSKDEYFSANTQGQSPSARPLDSAQDNDADDKSYADDLLEKAEIAAIDIMDKAQDRADEFIREAKISANEIEAEALKNANDVYENAKKRAYEEGYEAGFQQGRSDADAVIAEALEIKEEINRKNRDFLVDKEAEMIDIVMAIAEKILREEMEKSEYMEALISQAMDSMSYARDIIIRVSDADFANANLIRPKILAMAERIENLDITIDHSLEEGSVVVDTPSGSIDASVSTQLEILRGVLLNELSSKEHEK